MKIGILSRAGQGYTTRRLVEAAKSAQHQVYVLDPFRFSLLISVHPNTSQSTLCFRSDNSSLPPSTQAGVSTPVEDSVGDTHGTSTAQELQMLYDGALVDDFDLILPRLSTTTASFASEVVAHFETLGVPLLNKSQQILVARHKFRSLRRLTEHGIPVIPSFTTGSPDFLENSVSKIGAYPILMKPFQGTHGRGLMLLDTAISLRSSVEAMCELHQNYVVQPFIGSSSGRDIRIIVIGGQAVAAMQRTAQVGEYRANFHRGGRGQLISITDQLRDLATRATAAMGLEVAGVDLLETNGMLEDTAYAVLEVNPSPGLEEIEAVTQIGIAEAIIEHGEQVATEVRHLPMS